MKSRTTNEAHNEVEVSESSVEERAAYSAPALEKGLDILELLAAEAEPMTVRQISARLGRSKSEIFRMVFVLVDRGYLRRDAATDQLSLSNRLFELGMRTPRPRALVEVALPVMERLTNVIGHATHLVVINRGETVVIANVAARMDFSFTLQLGYSRPAIEANSGRMIIALQPAERRAAMIRDSYALIEMPPPLDRLNEQLDRIAAAGSIIAASHHLVGITDICAPVLDRSGRAMACLSAPCLQRVGMEWRFEDIRDRMVEACRDMSQALL
jgi:DNA-binding IclR family transcriptional regulator